MRPGHVASALLVGSWVLVTPPAGDHPYARYGIESYTPAATYDSASACEAVRRKRAAAVLAAGKRGVVSADVATYRAGKCVPSDVAYGRTAAPQPAAPQHHCHRATPSR